MLDVQGHSVFAIAYLAALMPGLQPGTFAYADR